MTKPLSARLAAAASDDYALWREANFKMMEGKTGREAEKLARNMDIIAMAVRLNNPALLIAVAMSLVPGNCQLQDLMNHEDGMASAKLRGRLPERASCLWNALGSAALKVGEEKPRNAKNPPPGIEPSGGS